jgi:hypothetical protein
MQRFFYNDKTKIAALINQLNTAMELYNGRQYNSDKELLKLLGNGIRDYKALGYPDKESQIHSLQAEIVTAQRGINPYTLQRQTLRRNEMLQTVQFKILQALELQLRTDYTAAEETLQQASVLVSQIIVAAVQGGLLNDTDIKKLNTQQDIENAWKKLDADANILFGKKRVLLLVSKFDALILFVELL